MKPSITLDFLRGILFTFVAHECYIFSNALWTGLQARWEPMEVGTAGLLLIVYVILLLGLLFRPDRSAKTVFIFLSLFCLPPIGSAIYWLNYPSRSASSFALHDRVLHFAAYVYRRRHPGVHSLPRAPDAPTGLRRRR